MEDANKNLVEQNTSHEDEAYSFRLFAKSGVPGPQEGEEQGPPKISLRSPSPASGEPGFVHTERSVTYYFTGETSAERAEQYRIAAVSGEQLLQGLGTRWVCSPVFPVWLLLTVFIKPGFEMPWRVTILKATGRIMATSSFDTSQTVIGKKKRIGKKRRIAVRKHKAAEREKRTKKNRDKKVKKRQKEKLKRGEEGEISGTIPFSAAKSGVGDPP